MPAVPLTTRSLLGRANEGQIGTSPSVLGSPVFRSTTGMKRMNPLPISSGIARPQAGIGSCASSVDIFSGICTASGESAAEASHMADYCSEIAMYVINFYGRLTYIMCLCRVH